MASVERSVGVFGEELLLWVCLLLQSPRRPPPDHVFRQANLLLDELKMSKEAQALPVQIADDGMFAIAALIDEVAMAFPDLRMLWGQRPLQAARWMTNNAGVEFYDRLRRVREASPNVLATFMVVLGIGFLGKYGLPGANRYELVQFRHELTVRLGVDPDRDRQGGVLKQVRSDAGPSKLVAREPWFKQLWFGRAIALTSLALMLLSLVLVIVSNV
ncbi:MAG: DotU family type IV/VI secretion system protein [Polyangiaceae bacterium]|nr:DotU family type IV/VI secretion system protein [Polyangiaceae bacterium]